MGKAWALDSQMASMQAMEEGEAMQRDLHDPKEVYQLQVLADRG
jgi:hypothetical protein